MTQRRKSRQPTNISKPLTPYQERKALFASHGSTLGMSFSQGLVVSTYVMLCQALNERARPVHRQKGTHYTQHAPATVVLAVSAFDAWSSEFATGLDRFHGGAKDLAGEQPFEKYEKLSRLLSGTLKHGGDLRLAIEMRNEIVHFRPKGLPPGHLPTPMAALDARGLLIKGTSSAEYLFSQKLFSYGLAYFVCDTVARCAVELIELVPEDEQPFCYGGIATQFPRILDVLSLPDFDAQHGIDHDSLSP